MLTIIGKTFPSDWQYGPEEIAILKSTAKQIDDHFPEQNNLLINTTWFGPQFAADDNTGWIQVETLINQNKSFDNLFLLSVIDPMYLMSQDLEKIQTGLNIQNTHYIGMHADSKFEWNFHSFTTAQHSPEYNESELLPTEFNKAFLLYQRKPRPHRLEVTKRLIKENLLDFGIVTLGSNENHNYDWTDGDEIPLVLTIDDDPADYKHNGNYNEFGGIPNDLVTLGRLDIWRSCLLNVVSETEFDPTHPRFITEKMWKPIIGLRPFLIHGQTSIYGWLRNHGFRTFNQYWSHVDVEGNADVHATTIEVLKYLSNKSADELMELYQSMLPDIRYNKTRYYEFANEQYYKMQNLFL
jgi:hypothetical protein